MKTSLNDPLKIAEVSPPGVPGVIGLTLCPGKKDRDRGWDRDLDIDVAAIRDWGAEVVVSLIQTRELKFLEVTNLRSVVERLGMRWVHLPIRDVSVPKRRFEARWGAAGADLRGVVRRGGRVFVHCRGGFGRAATSLGRLRGEQGRRVEARDLLAPVYGWFSEGFDTADLKEAKTLLDEVSGVPSVNFTPSRILNV
jgi:hypothetical protein